MCAPTRQDFSPKAGRPEKLSAHALRDATEIRLFGGKGTNCACDLCHVVIGSNEVEYEVEAEAFGRRFPLHFHPRCYDAWKAGSDEACATPPS